ncbi:hypothetical protein BOTBODRAFT_467592 [Botryobasidium botryosum FD-172 SS1]|uniref:Uncharacterized protein n=1 Tax=Botryobasidium botryosum (strain FD-172 SS1) TaxID=930990 RepID=A0A067M8X0_BOTB1|nr:hypothetical protein BOTBODRAFT_467592 [Botryobasidium botryosum FD-172 SS1]
MPIPRSMARTTCLWWMLASSRARRCRARCGSNSCASGYKNLATIIAEGQGTDGMRGRLFERLGTLNSAIQNK